MPNLEAKILHETANLYLYDAPGGLEIRLNGLTHSVLVGKPTQGVERAKLTMARLELGIDNVRAMYQCPGYPQTALSRLPT